MFFKIFFILCASLWSNDATKAVSGHSSDVVFKISDKETIIFKKAPTEWVKITKNSSY